MKQRTGTECQRREHDAVGIECVFNEELYIVYIFSSSGGGAGLTVSAVLSCSSFLVVFLFSVTQHQVGFRSSLVPT